MAVCLKKGQKVDLTKGNPGLRKITVGLGWDVNRYDSGADFDLDASAFMLGANGKVTRDEDFIFYGNGTHPSGAVVYGGDNRTGAGEGDDEQIHVDLQQADRQRIRKDRIHRHDLRSRREKAELRPGQQRLRPDPGRRDRPGADPLRSGGGFLH